MATTSSSNRRALSVGVVQASLPEIDVRLADVVGILAALGEPAGKRHLARVAPDQAAEQVGASDSAGVAELGCPGAQVLANELELGLGDDGGERLLHPDGFALVLGVGAPEQLPRFSNRHKKLRYSWAVGLDTAG